MKLFYAMAFFVAVTSQGWGKENRVVKKTHILTIKFKSKVHPESPKNILVLPKSKVAKGESKGSK